jgi:3-deoxy-D-manno-octulosonic-acid transferase
MWLLYQLATTVALILAAPFLLLGRGGHYLPTVRHRLGLAPPPGPDGRPLWIHAVSVGEVGVAATLIQALPSDLPLLVTTVTPTGQDRARASLGDRATITYLPFELGLPVRRLFDRYNPRGLVLVEGDLWPLVLREARRRRLPVMVVNGRVGQKSYRRMRRLRRFLGPLLGPVHRFAVQEAVDRQRLEELGVEPGRIVETGNLKFDTPPPAPAPEAEELLRRLAGERPVLVAGSTMTGEEEAALTALSAAGGGEAALLVLAPRHPERWDEVARLVTGRGIALESSLRSTGWRTAPSSAALWCPPVATTRSRPRASPCRWQPVPRWTTSPTSHTASTPSRPGCGWPTRASSATPGATGWRRRGRRRPWVSAAAGW